VPQASAGYIGHPDLNPNPQTFQFVVVQVGGPARGVPSFLHANGTDEIRTLGGMRASVVEVVVREGGAEQIPAMANPNVPAGVIHANLIDPAASAIQRTTVAALTTLPADVRAGLLREATQDVQGSGGGTMESTSEAGLFPLRPQELEQPAEHYVVSLDVVTNPPFAQPEPRFLPLASGVLGDILPIDLAAVEQGLQGFLQDVGNVSQWVVTPASSRVWAAGWFLAGIGMGAFMAQVLHSWLRELAVERISLSPKESSRLYPSHFPDLTAPGDQP
jgi:hypothetical protein